MRKKEPREIRFRCIERCSSYVNMRLTLCGSRRMRNSRERFLPGVHGQARDAGERIAN